MAKEKKKIKTKVRKGIGIRKTAKVSLKTRARAKLKGSKAGKARKAQEKQTAPAQRSIYKRRNEMLSTAMGRQQLISLGGENTICVLGVFSKDMSDEELSKKAKIKVSEVRAVLNRLHSIGIVEYAREKDPSSGWYSYVWRMKEGAVEKFSEQFLAQQGREVGESAQVGEIYYCKACGPASAVRFENAFEWGFACKSCGKALTYVEESEKGRLFKESGANQV